MAEQISYKLTISGPDLSDIQDLSFGLTTLGRIMSNDIPLPDPKVSRHHATIELRGDRCSIIDMGSANGTLVNGKRIEPNQPVQLSANTQVEIGPYKLKLVLTGIDQEIELDQVAAEFESPAGEVKSPSGADEPLAKKKLPKQVPPPRKPPLPPFPELPLSPMGYAPPPGLADTSIRLINYLPAIYHTDFVIRFLSIFESLLLPIEWGVDNFDLYLDPGTTPAMFLNWMAEWFDIHFDPTWREESCRKLLKNAYQLFSRRGTGWALSKLLEIYTGSYPEIDDQSSDLEPHTFRVKLPLAKNDLNVEYVKKLIEINKPAHTSYVLEFKE